MLIVVIEMLPPWAVYRELNTPVPLIEAWLAVVTAMNRLVGLGCYCAGSRSRYTGWGWNCRKPPSPEIEHGAVRIGWNTATVMLCSVKEERSKGSAKGRDVQHTPSNRLYAVPWVGCPRKHAVVCMYKQSNRNYKCSAPSSLTQPDRQNFNPCHAGTCLAVFLKLGQKSRWLALRFFSVSITYNFISLLQRRRVRA